MARLALAAVIVSLPVSASAPQSLSERGPSRLSAVPSERATGAAAASSARSESDPALVYWHHLAQKRLRLLGKRERRIVVLLKRLRGRSEVRSRRRGGSVVGGTPRNIICSTFGSYCSQALRVAWCESRFNVRATNGDYWGLFQFGSYARARYGFAWNAWTQARAAYRYFRDAGWSPWTCKP